MMVIARVVVFVVVSVVLVAVGVVITNITPAFSICLPAPVLLATS